MFVMIVTMVADEVAQIIGMNGLKCFVFYAFFLLTSSVWGFQSKDSIPASGLIVVFPFTQSESENKNYKLKPLTTTIADDVFSFPK